MLSTVPVLLPLITLGAALAALVVGDSRPRLLVVALAAQSALVVCAALLLDAALADVVLVQPLGGWAAPAGIVFAADGMSALLVAVLLVVFCAAITYAFLDEESASRSRVLALVFLLEMGVLGAVLTGDAFNFYVFFELMGLSAYGLVGYRRSPAHIEASLKFATLSLVASTLMLMGVGAIYAQTGRLTFASFYESSTLVASQPLYLFSMGMVLTALCLKCALVPLHFWLPDAHSIAPTAISVILSGAVVKVGAYGIFRFLGSQAPWVWADVREVLMVAGASTAAIAALAAVAQRDLKRLLAYSTASQMGYVVAAAALGTGPGVAAALVAVAAHAIMKSTLFLGAGALMAATGERRWDQMGGLLRGSPALAGAMFVAMLSLAGIPPLVGFSGKLAVFGALVGQGAWAALACLLFASAVMIYLMVRLWLGLFGGKSAVRRFARGKVALTLAMAGLVIVCGVASGPLLAAATSAAADLLSGDAYRAAILNPSEPR